MLNDRPNSSTRMPAWKVLLGVLVTVVIPASVAAVPAPAPDTRLKGLDAYMEKIVKDWNVPGIGVGVVVKDRLVFAKGYGFRDYGRKQPFTSATTVPFSFNATAST